MNHWPTSCVEVLSGPRDKAALAQWHIVPCTAVEFDLEPDRSPDNAGWLTVKGIDLQALRQLRLTPSKVEFTPVDGETLRFDVERDFELGADWATFAVTEDSAP
jgi:hypothetical protein